MTFFFKCVSNPNAAVMEFDTHWDAEEMRKHPDYMEVDAQGDLILNPAMDAPNRIPFTAPQPAKRPTLGIPKRA